MVRTRREIGDAFMGYVRRRSVGVVIAVHRSWSGAETRYTVRFSGRTVDSLTEGDITAVK